ncbi:MAG: hypothetical protein WKF57_06185 [Nakamurella sp.]
MKVPTRTPAGIPTGGQFAAQQHAEADLALDATSGPVYDDSPFPDTIDVDGETFHLSRDGVYPGEPYQIMLRANRSLSDEEIKRMAQLVGYTYRSTVAGESIGDPDRTSPEAFVVSADTTKSQRDDAGQAMEEFEEQLPELLQQGSPVRKTDRAGVGTKGTRLIDGLAEPRLRIGIYYDDVFVPGS